MKDNKGLSLIELIVVIAIMAVLIGGSIFGLSMLLGVEARSACKSMDAQLNDIKTGAMSRASECMYIYYIDVPSGDEDAYAQKGIDSPGFYADKRIETIDNTTTIVQPIGDSEYSRIGAKKVTIKATIGGTDYEIKNDGTTGIMLEFDRKSGKLKNAQMGTMSGTSSSADGTWSSSGDGVITKMTFESGVRTYTITFDAEVGTHKIES